MAAAGEADFAKFCNQKLADPNHEKSGELPVFLKCAPAHEKDSVHLENNKYIEMLDVKEQSVIGHTLSRFK